MNYLIVTCQEKDVEAFKIKFTLFRVDGFWDTLPDGSKMFCGKFSEKYKNDLELLGKHMLFCGVNIFDDEVSYQNFEKKIITNASIMHVFISISFKEQKNEKILYTYEFPDITKLIYSTVEKWSFDGKKYTIKGRCTRGCVPGLDLLVKSMLHDREIDDVCFRYAETEEELTEFIEAYNSGGDESVLKNISKLHVFSLVAPTLHIIFGLIGRGHHIVSSKKINSGVVVTGISDKTKIYDHLRQLKGINYISDYVCENVGNQTDDIINYIEQSEAKLITAEDEIVDYACDYDPDHLKKLANVFIDSNGNSAYKIGTNKLLDYFIEAEKKKRSHHRKRRHHKRH